MTTEQEKLLTEKNKELEEACKSLDCLKVDFKHKEEEVQGIGVSQSLSTFTLCLESC